MAVRFSASTDAYTATTGLPAGAAFTVTCWFLVAVDRNDFSAAWFLEDSGEGVGLVTDADGTTLRLYDGAFTTIGGHVLTVGVWYRVAVVVSGTNMRLRIGQAGSALTEYSTTTASVPATFTTLHVGSDLFAEWSNSRLAALKVWSAALSDAELDLELGQYLYCRTANLLRWHPFIGAGITDYSGNGNSLTAGGTAATTEDGPPIPWIVSPPYTQPAQPRRRAATF